MVILGSTSTTRINLLKQAGVDFTSIAPDVEEVEKQKQLRQLDPVEMAKELAGLKALSLTNQYPDSHIIGADQILHVGKTVFHKPKNLHEAKNQLKSLRGITHNLSSALACAHAGKLIWQTIHHAKLSMRMFSDEFLEDYLESVGDKIYNSVGGYQIENQGLQLFEKIEGDYFTILGFPLIPLLEFLRSEKLILS